MTADDIHTATPVSDTSKLEAAIKAAEALNKDDYTEKTWSDLEAGKRDLKQFMDQWDFAIWTRKECLLKVSNMMVYS